MNFAELKYVDGSERCPSTPTGLAGRLFLKTPLPHLKFESFRPDLNIAPEFDLNPHGVEATVLPTGGHTHLGIWQSPFRQPVNCWRLTCSPEGSVLVASCSTGDQFGHPFTKTKRRFWRR